MALSDEPTRAHGIKRVIQKAARVVGLHVGRYPPVDSLAYHLKTLLRQLEIDCVLDVGAHEGEFSGFLRDLDYAGEIISFEPVAASFAKLTRADANAIAAYLQNLQPLSNKVPGPFGANEKPTSFVMKVVPPPEK